MSEFAPKLENQSLEFDEANARQFLGWMFPRYSPELIAEIPEGYLPTLFNALEHNARARWSEIPKSRRKKQLLAPLGLVKPWVEGLTINQIANQSGRSVDSINFSLISYAENIGRLEDLDDLLADCQNVIETTAPTPEISPEPVLEPAAEIEIEQAQAEPEPQEPEPLPEDEVPQDEPEEDGEIDQNRLEELARYWNNY